VTTNASDFNALSHATSLNPDVLRGLPVVADFGYFRVARAKEMLWVRYDDTQ
jgi:hypothetical protein